MRIAHLNARLGLQSETVLITTTILLNLKRDNLRSGLSEITALYLTTALSVVISSARTLFPDYLIVVDLLQYFPIYI